MKTAEKKFNLLKGFRQLFKVNLNSALVILRNLASYRYKLEILNGIKRGWFPIFVKYPLIPIPRYGYGKPVNKTLYEIIDSKREAYSSTLQQMSQYNGTISEIKTTIQDEKQPYWDNPWFSGLDAIALYFFIAKRKPGMFLEIGSGNSTKFARQAILNQGLNTKITSVDPQPRSEIDAISDTIIRKPLEEVDIDALFDTISGNDIVFFDGSHRSFMNSDVTVFFLEVLPKIPAGTLIHIHDIHIPYDYPPERAHHYESEQYLLASMLLGGCSNYEIVFPTKFILNDEKLCGLLDCYWNNKQQTIHRTGSSFWLQKIN